VEDIDGLRKLNGKGHAVRLAAVILDDLHHIANSLPEGASRLRSFTVLDVKECAANDILHLVGESAQVAQARADKVEGLRLAKP
jgi:hypothetical protein